MFSESPPDVIRPGEVPPSGDDIEGEGESVGAAVDRGLPFGLNIERRRSICGEFIERRARGDLPQGTRGSITQTQRNRRRKWGVATCWTESTFLSFFLSPLALVLQIQTQTGQGGCVVIRRN